MVPLLIFATLFTAQDVNHLLTTPEQRKSALQWCQSLGISHVFLETFRGEYAREDLLKSAKEEFEKAGFTVSGCVTPVSFGKKSTGWNLIVCYTNPQSQEELEEIFRFTAKIFDEIIIDDFLFTDCECEECQRAKGSLSWAEYRLNLMFKVSKEHILKPARSVNPRVKLILKYPQWYDLFQERGYDVLRQTQAFDRIWIGTETRNPESIRWGAKQQYEAYFIYRWLSEIAGRKARGGWFDPYDCSPETYVEQAYQTVLAGAPEIFLFHYGELIKEANRPLIERLKAKQKILHQLASISQKAPLRGVAAYKPPHSAPEGEDYLFDFIGMLGIPFKPTYRFPLHSPSAFFSLHSLKDPNFPRKLAEYLAKGGIALITSGLKERLEERGQFPPGNLLKPYGPIERRSYGKGEVLVLPTKKPFTSLYSLPQEDLDLLRNRLLQPLKVEFLAPPRTALYLFGDKDLVIENFNNEPVAVRWNSGSPWAILLSTEEGASGGVIQPGEKIRIPARGLVRLHSVSP